jgi:protein-S-isoprenylcysteine O-methyltransferase Ste14
MHGETDTSRTPRFVLTGLHLLGIAAAAWLLLGGGLPAVGRAVGVSWSPGDPGRRALLLGFSLVYFLRFVATTFSLLSRRVGWDEAFIVGAFVAVVHVAFAALGGRSPAPLGGLDAVAAAAFVLGSFLNTGSELQRKRWKADPANRGHLYTRGLFRLSMHVNYFGDVVLFSGFALLTRSPWALLVPAVMAAGFVFHHIPSLDDYLRRRYGAEFEAYEERTRRFVPFVY